jgi:hypothetical protein
MTPERWKRVDQLYHSARERERGRRGQFPAEACAGDLDLLREVESLLAQDSARDAILDRPAWEGAGALLDATVSRFSASGQLGPYRIERPIGEGGTGVVYRALDTRLNRPVAIKFLSFGGADQAMPANRKFVMTRRCGVVCCFGQS